MRLQILELAKDDLIEGYYFYERTEPGLGDFYLTNLYSDIESLMVFGGIHRKTYRGFHRAISKRFPFAIYYTVENEIVRIRSVVDCRRRPWWIRGHLKNASTASRSPAVSSRSRCNPTILRGRDREFPGVPSEKCGPR